MKRSRVLMLMMFVCAVTTAPAFGNPFTPGNLVVVRPGQYGSNGNAVASFLDEYTPTGVLVQSLALPTTVSGPHRRLTLSGNGGHEGILSRSADGRYLTLGGYDSPPGAATTGDRVIGRVDAGGIVDTATALSNTYVGTGVFSSVATDDGTRFWLGGSAGNDPSSGIRYATYGATNSVRLATNPTSTISTKVFGGQLYASSSVFPFRGVNSVGSGLPTTGGQTVTNLPGTGGATPPIPTDFYLASPDLLYICDARVAASGGGIQRWERTGGTWTLDYTLALGANRGCYGLTGTYDAGLGTTRFFATTTDGIFGTLTGNSLVSITDSGPGSAFTLLATAASQNPPGSAAFLGVAFAPVPEPSTLSLLLLAAPIAWRRRRSCPGS